MSSSPEYARAHYEANKDAYKARAKAYTAKNRIRIREYLNELKSTSPCADCGRNEPDKPWRMDFDHVRGEKICNLADMVRRSPSMKRVLEEIEKCEIVCKLCHADRTHERKTLRDGVIGNTHGSEP